MMEYHVVAVPDIEEFIKEVNYHLNLGWTLQGGIHHDTAGRRNWSQALVREKMRAVPMKIRGL